jgi:hypothetical protein
LRLQLSSRQMSHYEGYQLARTPYSMPGHRLLYKYRPAKHAPKSWT